MILYHTLGGELIADVMIEETNRRFLELALKVPELASGGPDWENITAEQEEIWDELAQKVKNEAIDQLKRFLDRCTEAQTRVLRLLVLEKIRQLGDLFLHCASEEIVRDDHNKKQFEMNRNDLYFALHLCTVYEVQHSDISDGYVTMIEQIKSYLDAGTEVQMTH
jgi:hypothetical protein